MGREPRCGEFLWSRSEIDQEASNPLENGKPAREQIRVFLISEHRLFAEAVTAALEEVPGLAVTGYASTFAAARALMKSCIFEILLLDARIDSPTVLATAREIKAALPGVKLLILGLNPSEENILSFIECGVNGYLIRHSSLPQLVEALEAAHREEMSYSPRLITLAVYRLRKLSQESDQPLLSLREREILQLVSRGLANKEIATRLGISTATAKNHVHNILHKLKAANRREAIRRASLANIITERFEPNATNGAPQPAHVAGNGKIADTISRKA